MATPASWLVAVTARVPNQTLVALTLESKETQDTTTPDTDVINAAIDDAKAEFATLSGFAPDLASPDHVGAVVQGVIAYLKTYKSLDNDDTDICRIRFVAMCRQIRAIFTSAPGSTNSGTNSVTPAAENPNSRIIRPDSDRSRFRRGFLADNRTDYDFSYDRI